MPDARFSPKAAQTMVSANRILICRLGSIGDFVIALPCLHLVRRRFPQAKITLLTNQPVEARAAPARSILKGSGLVDEYLTYPVATRNYQRLLQLSRQIRDLAPDLLVYLASRRALWQVARDYLYFRGCGVRHAVGFPFATADRRSCPPVMEGGYWGHEAQRLARTLLRLGDAEPWEPASWDLGLTAAEQQEAERLLRGALPVGEASRQPLGLSVGTKQAINDWGDDNWRAVLRHIADPLRPLLLIGSGEERSRSQGVAEAWPGPVLNFCGRTSPRVSAALIARTELFLCHDSGPMHLAAAVRTRCVAVFSRNRPPGRWFPFGVGHRVFYPRDPSGTIFSILPAEVATAALEVLFPLPAAARFARRTGI